VLTGYGASRPGGGGRRGGRVTRWARRVPGDVPTRPSIPVSPVLPASGVGGGQGEEATPRGSLGGEVRRGAGRGAPVRRTRAASCLRRRRGREDRAARPAGRRPRGCGVRGADENHGNAELSRRSHGVRVRSAG